MSINKNNGNEIRIEFFKTSDNDAMSFRNRKPLTQALGCPYPIQTRWEVCTAPRTSICAINPAAEDERR